MRYSKKFQNVGRTKGVIIPMAWIKSEERRHKKKMIGVHIDANDILQMTPMWEE